MYSTVGQLTSIYSNTPYGSGGMDSVWLIALITGLIVSPSIIVLIYWIAKGRNEIASTWAEPSGPSEEGGRIEEAEEAQDQIDRKKRDESAA